MVCISSPTKLNTLAQVALSELMAPDKATKEVLLGSDHTLSERRTAPLDTMDDPNPIQYLERLFAKNGIRLSRRRCSMTKASIPRPTFDEIEAYCQETALAVRQGDLPKLKELYYKQGFSLNACNRFGESLLHVGCRRGNAKMVEFMIVEAKVNPRVIDDMGRTAFHDVCWSSSPNLDTMDVLLKVLPPIGLLMQDCRGHSPLQYAPRKDWGVWLEYLQEREHVFVNWIREKKARAAAAALLKRGVPQVLPVPIRSPQVVPARATEMSPSAA